MISIIIIVKNDRGIDNTLNRLAKIKKPEKTETIVIDASNGLIDDIKKMHPLVRWIYYYNKTNKKITIPEQRNLGLTKSKGNIIAFIDANCIPNNNWLFELTKLIISKDENIVAGSVKSMGDNSMYDMFWDSRKNVTYVNECATINLAFSRRILKNVGLFDENIPIGEDIDFTWRIVDAGYKIRYNKNAIISHDWGNLSDEIKRAFNYGAARPKLYKKHPDKWRNLISHELTTLVYPVYILLLPIALFFPYYLLFILIPVLKNIRKSPLKVVFLNFIYGYGVLHTFFYLIITTVHPNKQVSNTV